MSTFKLFFKIIKQLLPF